MKTERVSRPPALKMFLKICCQISTFCASNRKNWLPINKNWLPINKKLVTNKQKLITNKQKTGYQ
jgi:hypothetical protein